MGVTSGCHDWRCSSRCIADAIDCTCAIVWAVMCFAEFTGWHWVWRGREGVAKGREGFLVWWLLLIKLPTFVAPYIISPMRSGR